MKRKLLSVLVSFSLILPTVAQSGTDSVVIQKILELGREDNLTMRHLDILTNRFGGRPIGSDAYDNALQWAARQFESWGLEVSIEEVGSLPVGFNRGPWFGRMLDHEDGMTLHFATPSYSSGTKGVQRGPVLMEPKSQAEFDRIKKTLKGAWVLITGESDGLSIDHSQNGDRYRDSIIAMNIEINKQNAENKAWNKNNPKSKPKEIKELLDAPALFYRQMVDAGILGIIQSSEVPITAHYDKNLFNLNFDSLPNIPDIKLNQDQYKLIEKKVKERQFFLLEFDIRNHFKMGPVKYHNLIAKMPGSEFPDEYVMCGGHLDAYDVATGAVDCGTGVAPTMEAARLLAMSGAKPKRTILFCLWTGEEFGILGSKHWVENNQDKWPNIINYFNRDGGPTVANSISVPKDWYEDILHICEPLSKHPDFPFTVNLNENYPVIPPTRGGATDNAYFHRNAIPAISFGTSDTKGYNFSYYEIWHTDRDTYDKSIPEYMEHTSVVNAVVLLGIANLEQRLPRSAVYK